MATSTSAVKQVLPPFQIQGDANLCARSLLQDERLVTDIVATDIVDTNAYVGVGINGSPDCERTVNWCKQGTDKIIDGQIVSKARPELEALVNPATVIIQSVGIASTKTLAKLANHIAKKYNEDVSWDNEIKYFSNCLANNFEIERGSIGDALETMTLVETIYKADPEWKKKYYN